MCGFIGVYGPEGVDVAPELYEGLISIQHRGQDAAGIVTFTDTFHLKKGSGLVRDLFHTGDMERLKGNMGLGHVRYPTIGVGDEEDAQPFHVNFPIGVAMAHNGNLTNYQALQANHCQNSGMRMNSTCDLEVLLYVFVRALAERVRPGQLVTAKDVFEAVAVVYEEVKGAYSVVAVLPDVGLLAFRDPYGIKPICFGSKQTDEGNWFAVASESVVLDVAGYGSVENLAAGEALFVGTDGVPQRKVLADKPHRPCIFELVYFARPDSMLDEISVYKTRVRFGEALADQWRAADAPTPDVVIPIPDSSRDAAQGMASRLGIPYAEGLVKNRYIGRTFIMPSQQKRTSSVRRKLNAIKLEFEGKNVCLVDDSIVRGNTARRIVRMAREAGAKRVYLAITSPPLVSPCPYGVDMATKTEFIASGCDAEEVANKLEADFLLYLDRDAMNAAARVGNPKVEKFCNACFTGRYPTEDITPEVLEAIGSERADSRQKRLPFRTATLASAATEGG